MSTTLQVVNSSGTVLFDLNDPTGVANPYGLKTEVALGGAFDLGSPETEFTIISSTAAPGGEVVMSRDPLVRSSWRQRIVSTSVDNLMAGVGELAALIAVGGILKWAPHGSAVVRYIDFEASIAPAVLEGQALGLWQVANLFESTDGVAMQILRQPYLRSAELDPLLNLATNPTLTHDFASPSGRPDGWTWDSTTGISGESIVEVTAGGGQRSGAYQFTIADAGVHNLQQTTAVGTVSSGQVAPFAFDARVVAVAGTPQVRAMVEYMQSDGTTQVGADQNGSLATLTTRWQRVTVTPAAAGALTSRVRVSLQIDNVDATSVVVQLRNAQPEVAAAPTDFRCGDEAVAYNPTSTSLPRRMAVWGGGNAPSPAKLKVTSDALTLKRFRLYRVSERAIDVLKATLHKSLRSGTLGADTTSVADSDGVDGNVAEVAYTEPDPSFGTDAVASGSGDTITVAKPSSLAAGECMLAYVYRQNYVSQITAQAGWSLLGYSASSTANSVLFVFYKIADALDASAAVSSYTFEVIYPSGGLMNYRAWIGRYANIDQLSPIEDFEFTQENATTAATAASLVTSYDDAMIVLMIGAELVAGSGTISFTAPAGATPTYTEQDDGGSGVTWLGAAAYTGVLATAGSTGTKDVTVSGSADTIMCHVALRKAPAVIAPRSTVTFAGTGTGALPPGEYDVWLRYRTTAVCYDRLRVEYGLKASPSVWVPLPDVIVDTRAASTFTEYQEHLMGRLHVPADRPLDTLTVRVSAGREAISAANMRLDAVLLAPAWEHVAALESPSVLASGEHLASDASNGVALHLATDSDLSEVATVQGPTPLELVPGYQVLYGFGVLGPLTGFTDPATEVTAAPTLAVTHSPRYRT